ncbi:MAG: HD domain-containing protein [Gemmataceae bacterium]|nr:HD domain-containing protein [Gemmataceae bacterium]
MSKVKKPVIAKLSDLRPGDHADCFVQLAEKTRGTTRDGNPFYTCKFRDAMKTVGAVPIWSDSPLFASAEDWQSGQFFKVRVTYTENEKYGPQLAVEQIRPVEDRDRADGFSELDFVERSRFNPDEMLSELEGLAGVEIADVPLRTLTVNLLKAHATALKVLPASTRHAYPFAGGWLEHTLAVTRTALWLSDRYAARFPELIPPLNRSLVVASAILHDIGRVRGVDAPPGQPGKPSVAGELFGPLVLGYDLIRDAAKSVPDLNPELLELLLHCVVAHQKGERGANPPAIPEALILHHADALDSSFEMYARCLTRDNSEGPFTDRDAVLNRQLLKARKV